MVQLTEKGTNVRRMFDTIAPRYDLLNRLLSFGIDRRWRRQAVGLLSIPDGGRVLDVATGTGDVALEIARQTPASVTIDGIDFSPEMVGLGRRKIARTPWEGRISLHVAPCEEIPFPDDTFDGATIAFGIRNVDDRPAGLAEICRVLKPGGTLVVLEFSTPRSRLFRAVYSWYFSVLLPRIGGLLSDFDAYRYLPESVGQFPSRGEFTSLMGSAGFGDIFWKDLTFGIVTLYSGTKLSPSSRTL